MITFEQLQSKKEKICVVGLGYVGLPLALLLSKYYDVIGFDIDEAKIVELREGVDRNGEIDMEELDTANIEFTSNADNISSAKFIISALPTPIDENNLPDLRILKSATQTIGRHLSEGSIVVYESTVYPGLTEEICLPILEKESGLKAGEQFKIGYSPERVNPGDKKHSIDKIVKVVSAIDQESLEVIASIYGTFTEVFRAKSVKVAEAAKVIENTQRDLNIALMNELAILFSKMNINIYDVLEAASTKWNFLKFTPGLVGGHCIGVDPYYLTYKAGAVGHNPEVILAGRSINDSFHKFIAHKIIKKMVKMGKNISESNFVIFGITFKENVRDSRNSRVACLYHELESFGIKPKVYDPHADPDQVKNEYGIELVNKEDLAKADTLIVAVAHDEFKQMSADDIRSYMNEHDLLFVDVKNLFDSSLIEKQQIKYMSL